MGLRDIIRVETIVGQHPESENSPLLSKLKLLSRSCDWSCSSNFLDEEVIIFYRQVRLQVSFGEWLFIKEVLQSQVIRQS